MSNKIYIKAGNLGYAYLSPEALAHDMKRLESVLRLAKLNCVKAGGEPLTNPDIVEMTLHLIDMQDSVREEQRKSFLQ